MDLGNAIQRSGRDDITIRSVIANTISEIYKKKVEIQSVRLSKTTILIKTGNALINSELQMISSEILSSSKSKLLKMGILLESQTTMKFLS